jgi:hypothetical protein
MAWAFGLRIPRRDVVHSIAATPLRHRPEGEVHAMAADNRLTAEQFAALKPGDLVTIEFVRDFRRPKHVACQVVCQRSASGAVRRRPCMT